MCELDEFELRDIESMEPEKETEEVAVVKTEIDIEDEDKDRKPLIRKCL